MINVYIWMVNMVKVHRFLLYYAWFMLIIHVSPRCKGNQNTGGHGSWKKKEKYHREREREGTFFYIKSHRITGDQSSRLAGRERKSETIKYEWQVRLNVENWKNGDEKKWKNEKFGRGKSATLCTLVNMLLNLWQAICSRKLNSPYTLDLLNIKWLMTLWHHARVAKASSECEWEKRRERLM